MSAPSSSIAQHKFQAPKGTRDFYPDDMLVRRWIEHVWREVSINHGFEEIDGPTFEHLELYTVKSGQEIVNELFSFRRAGGDDDYALRPEFTPTLARMYASRAAQLPKPTKWFCMPSFFRAERPQRGRLREFQQWNVDIIGDDSQRADAEIIAAGIGVLEHFGFQSRDVTVHISHRSLIAEALEAIHVPRENHASVMQLLDRRAKLPPETFAQQAGELAFDDGAFRSRMQAAVDSINAAILAKESLSRDPESAKGSANAQTGDSSPAMDDVMQLIDHLAAADILRWCEFDPAIVRGLAYYTGIVFEIYEATGKERAIAGGGRYDHLIELFGGPPTPACGFAMGDVVIRLVLEEKGLLPQREKLEETLGRRPDVFVISAGKEDAEAKLPQLVSQLRGFGFHARHSYKATRNVGKLLGEAGKANARFALILGDELARGVAVLKDLDGGEQTEVRIDNVIEELAARLRARTRS